MMCLLNIMATVRLEASVHLQSASGNRCRDRSVSIYLIVRQICNDGRAHHHAQLSAEESQRIKALAAEIAAAEKELAGLRKSASGLQVSKQHPSQ